MVRSLLLMLSLLALPLVTMAADNGPTTGGEILRASVPGAYAVRYMPDRALISSSAKQTVELRVRLPHPPLWGYLDKTRLSQAALGWDSASSVAILNLHPGEHEAQVGWEGTGEQPEQGQKIAVTVCGKKAGELTANFSLEQMSAEGTVSLPVGVGKATLILPKGVDCGTPVLTLGNQVVSDWVPAGPNLESKSAVGMTGDTPMRLTLPGYNLLRSCVAVVSFSLLTKPIEVARVEKMPEDGVLVEAEDFTGQGGGTVSVSVGDHVDQHGGKSIFNYGGAGHWLEWTAKVPATGEYDLFARIACAEPLSLRELKVDGKVPSRAFSMVQFPATGGWAHAPGEWWFVQLAGSKDAPALKLTKGTHTFRLTTIMDYNLNVDYFVLRKR